MRYAIAIVLGALAITSCQAPALPTIGHYPDTRRDAHTDTYHGTSVHDPYRWLEDLESPEVIAWARQQDALLDAFLAESPTHNTRRELVVRLRASQGHGAPVRRDSLTMYILNQTDDWRPVIVVQRAGRDSMVIDPNALWSRDSSNVFSGFLPSASGAYIAYWTSVERSPWQRIHIVETATGGHLPDQIEGFRLGAGGVAWHGDEGFFYTKYEVPPAAQLQTAAVRGSGLAYHRVGTTQSADRLVLRGTPQNPSTMHPTTTHDGAHLVITEFVESHSRIAVVDLRMPHAVPRYVIPVADALYTFEGSDGDTLRFRTTNGAPNGRLIAVLVSNPAVAHWLELVAEGPDRLTSVSEVGDLLVLRYDGYPAPRLAIHDHEGRKLRDAPLPSIGSIGPPTDDRAYGESYYGFGSLSEPGTLYRLDPQTGTSTVAFRADLPYAPDDFVVRQVRFPSRDGTMVPMFLAHARDVDPGPETPVILYAYGANGFVARPFNMPYLVQWMKMGGIYAVAGVRGGGEFGAAWHEEGRGAGKKNSIDDFVAAARYLVATYGISVERLVANGGSAGAVVASAAMLDHPDLFGAALIDFPVLDLLRYDEFGSAASMRSEFGTAGNPDEFAFLHTISPYHNIVPGTCYPPTLVQVGEKDAAATPMHGYKFVAALQAAQSCEHPVVLQVAWGAGHSHGATNRQRDEVTADQLTFLVRVLGLDD